MKPETKTNLKVGIICSVLMALIFVGFIVFLSGCHYIPGYTDDNLVEEVAEAGITAYTGVDMDLTPESPER